MSISTIVTKKFVLIYIFWCLLWVAIQSFVLHNAGYEWHISVIDSCISNLVLSISGFVMTTVLRFYQPSPKNGIYLLIWSIGLSAISIKLLIVAMHFIFSNETKYLSFLIDSITLRFSFALLMIEFMTLLSWVWYYVHEQKDTETRKEDAEKLVREAELSKLRQQLQPHFLFNSLNSISALISARPEEARKMIQQLSDFLRGTLKKDEQQMVSLLDELKHLQLYLDIEKVRFGHRLATEIQSEESTQEMLLPSLLLQPIVENAIKFGLYDTIGEIVISIHTKAVDNTMELLVRNPFDPSTAQPRHGTGFGLNSVRRRLYLIYGRNDLLSTQINENIFTTIVKIPQIND